jgi:hypothetical protein
MNGVGEMASIFCTQCGTKLVDTSKFCLQCGSKLVKLEVESQGASLTKTVEVVQPDSQPSSSSAPLSSKSKSKVLKIVLISVGALIALNVLVAISQSNFGSETDSNGNTEQTSASYDQGYSDGYAGALDNQLSNGGSEYFCGPWAVRYSATYGVDEAQQWQSGCEAGWADALSDNGR